MGIQSINCHLQIILTLTFDLRAQISCCHLHTSGKHCVEYECPPPENIYLTLTFDLNVIYWKSLYKIGGTSGKNYKKSLCETDLIIFDLDLCHPR